MIVLWSEVFGHDKSVSRVAMYVADYHQSLVSSNTPFTNCNVEMDNDWTSIAKSYVKYASTAVRSVQSKLLDLWVKL